MAGKYASSKTALENLDSFLNSPTSFLNLYRPANKSIQSATVFNSQETRHIEPEQGQREPNYNPFFTFLTVFADPHTEWDVSSEFSPYLSALSTFCCTELTFLSSLFSIPEIV